MEDSVPQPGHRPWIVVFRREEKNADNMKQQDKINSCLRNLYNFIKPGFSFALLGSFWLQNNAKVLFFVDVINLSEGLFYLYINFHGENNLHIIKDVTSK